MFSLTKKIIKHQGIGCMSWAEFYGSPIDDIQVFSLVKLAIENGVNFFDTADVYGYGLNEEQVGSAISKIMGQEISTREEIVLATKCGIIREKDDPSKRGVDNSYDYVIDKCHQSLSRLGPDIGYIDLFYLHRVNKDQLEDSMKAMAVLLDEGKILSVGLSEASMDVIEKANSLLKEYTQGKHQISALQTELSLMSKQALSNGLLDFCRDNDISFVAYSPLCRALLTGEIENIDDLGSDDFRRSLPRFQKENIQDNLKLLDTVKSIAHEKSCTTAQVALAWVKSIGAIAIPGTTKENNLLSNIKSLHLNLTDDEIHLLSNIASAKGYRYTEAAMQAYGFYDEI